jgi:hypothetical protein
MELFVYTPENVEKACKIIMENLTPDLLPKKWIKRNSTNPMFGHCHTASACLQRLFGTANIKLYHSLDEEGIWHWWALTKEGKKIDITADQYYSVGKVPPYVSGKKASMLGFEYRKRTYKLLAIVKEKLLATGTPLLSHVSSVKRGENEQTN